ncbi:ImmA/IrrE family metallo-endopeptidase [Xinfangfangia sp. CPCC 101601]|uniref:ImmA/IrrE family metallo-endopeptidase n=1 Tax=Pseudogemmobacter lacusdianii TaxID=3069608 RepID=A0ABU0VU18_9RHOB|nr:ImmA/IrrE family metallo-endopeptidase [Xinfangfangia sp. CPCC 101601]MDQ2065227.1 ImmA/IrrE family metallo-endopeptidase [Xinfangfangia sp. CPCC 101601]
MSVDLLEREIGSEFRLVVAQSQPITPHLALQLERYVGGSKGFWLRRDAIYQDAISEMAPESEKEWVKSQPYNDMAKFGWIPVARSVAEKASHLFDFFNCDNVKDWYRIYEPTLSKVAFRTTFTFENDDAATVAWLRQGDIVAENIPCGPFDPKKLRENLDAIRRECRRSSVENFLPNIRSILASAGVRFVVVRAPSGCRASGATRINLDGSATLQLSFRYLSDDHFWFTLFHEIGHLILHSDRSFFLEGDFVDSDEIEREANAFASEILIPTERRSDLEVVSIRRDAIIRLAFRLGISPGILVGQMQHFGLMERSRMNYLKRRYKW